MLNWLTGPTNNPKHGDCFYNAEESIICVCFDGDWYNIGPIPDDISTLDDVFNMYESYKRNSKLKTILHE